MGGKKKQGGCLTLLIVWLFAALVIGFCLNGINKTGQGMDTIIVGSLFIGFMVALVVFCFRMVIITSRAQKVARKQLEQDKAAGISRYDNMIHVGGLEVPENCKCTAALSQEGLTITCAGKELLLRTNKIRNVEYQLDIDEKQYLKSSLAKGIAGAAMFGVSGAIIGSAPKTKTKREVKCYAIISYEGSDGQFKTFIVKDELPNLSCCAKLVDTLRPMIQARTNKIEL